MTQMIRKVFENSIDDRREILFARLRRVTGTRIGRKPLGFRHYKGIFMREECFLFGLGMSRTHGHNGHH